MKKKIIKGFVFLLLFAASFLVFKYFTDIIVKQFLQKEGGAAHTSGWKTVVDGVLAFAAANVFNMTGLYFEKKKESAAGAPYILLKKLDETLIRKDINRDGMSEIVIGQGKYFVYVTVKLENTGDGAITGSRIAGQRLRTDRIGPHESVQFRFRCAEKKMRIFRRTIVQISSLRMKRTEAIFEKSVYM